MKQLSFPHEMGAYNAMVWRNLLGCGLGLALFLSLKVKWPKRDTMKIHWLRGAISAAMAVTFFWGIARVPMAEAIALSFIAPLITLFLATVFLGEVIRGSSILASLLGLVGVFLILAGRWSGQPHDADAWNGIVSIFVSAILYAFNLVLQRKQAQVASPAEIVFFQYGISLLCLLTGGVLAMQFTTLDMPWSVPPQAHHWPLLIASALLSCGSLFLMSWAYARAETQLLVSVEYTALIWGAIFGWHFYKEAVTLATLFGSGLIVAACLMATRDEKAQIAA